MLIINNDVAMQKGGVSIRKPLENLDILIGSTYEQGFIRVGQFYKTYVQSSPEFRRFPKGMTICSSKTTGRKWSCIPRSC